MPAGARLFNDLAPYNRVRVFAQDGQAIASRTIAVPSSSGGENRSRPGRMPARGVIAMSHPYLWPSASALYGVRQHAGDDVGQRDDGVQTSGVKTRW
jgi:hypothetical protein